MSNPPLALETLAVADARRTCAALVNAARSVAAALRALGRAVKSWAEQVAKAFKVPYWLVALNPKPGYYLRDGKLRRDHSYFRQRARDRRAARHR